MHLEVPRRGRRHGPGLGDGSARLRRGILGGTFNPPHLGHLVCAQEAHTQLGLDRVTLIPTRIPPHKPVPDDPGPDVRLALCRAAAADDGRFDVSALELEREGPSWTVDTLAAVHEQAPEDELIFIAGGDMARSLPSWRDPRRILELARFAVAERGGVARAHLREQLAPLGSADRLAFFDMPRIDVSSSDVRRRMREGRPIRYLVPDPVRQEIETRRLYR